MAKVMQVSCQQPFTSPQVFWWTSLNLGSVSTVDSCNPKVVILGKLLGFLHLFVKLLSLKQYFSMHVSFHEKKMAICELSFCYDWFFTCGFCWIIYKCWIYTLSLIFPLLQFCMCVLGSFSQKKQSKLTCIFYYIIFNFILTILVIKF